MSRNELTTDLPYQRVLETLTKRELFAAMAPADEIDPGDLDIQGAAAELGITSAEWVYPESYFAFIARRRAKWADALLKALEARSE